MRRLYAETNFVLELVFSQQGNVDCEELLSGAEGGVFRLVVPSYCLGEPLETIGRRHAERRRLQERVLGELRQLGRSPDYRHAVVEAQAVTDLFARSTSEDRDRLAHVYRRVGQTALLVPVSAEVVEFALHFYGQYDLELQDAFVLASIVVDLTADPGESAFVTTNSKDFDDPELRGLLADLDCRLLTGFGEAVGFALHGI